MTDAAGPSLDALPALHVPPLLPEPPRPPFPWLATAAPVLGAVVIWAITGSVVSLAFAALGPLVAVAAVLDARRTARRTRRRQLVDREEQLGRLRSEVARRHDLERARAWRRTPAARALTRRAPAWSPGLPEAIVVGSGAVASRVSIEGAPGEDPEALRLVAEAAVLAEAPVRVALEGGVGFVGELALARASARAAIVQVAEATDPSTCRVVGPPSWHWLAALPHRAATPDAAVLRLVEEEAEPDASDAVAHPIPTEARGDGAVEVEIAIAIARDAVSLPPGVRTVVEVTASRHALVHVTGTEARAIEPELLSEAEARSAAHRLARIADRAGVASGRAALPDSIGLGELPPPAGAAADRASLAATVGVGAGGPVAIDLVRGPHALVAGTSGSGKSELLVTWIAAMAARYAPDRVAFLLVDFKGGAAFEPVRGLPHVAGLVTDLDEDEAARAVESIRAELRHRERVLSTSGARGIVDLPGEVTLPRLVVVVDEFQAMIERFGQLGAVVADVASRGRSLGVHLILASQRPNGIVREQVSANCGIRVSLRVLDRADSVAVLGVDGAARLDPGRPGRALLDPGDGRAVEFHSARADRELIAGIAARHADAARPRRPWLDPLPPSIDLDDVDAVLGAGGGAGAGAGAPRRDERAGSAELLLGAADEPAAQRRIAVTWNPEVDGPLVVLGAPGSGRTALLEALATQVARRHGPAAVLRLEGPRSAIWDGLAILRRGAGVRLDADARTHAPRLVLVDDVDLKLAGWPDEHRLAALDALDELMRAGRGAGPAIALAAGRVAALGSAGRDVAATQVLLRHPSRADLVHAGGDGHLHRGEAPPGAGQWRGRAAQFLRADRRTDPAPRVEAAPFRLDAARPVAVASARPGADADSIGRVAPGMELVRLADGPDAARRALSSIEAGGAGVVVLGDADAWAANWSLAAAARARAELLVHGGGSELRALLRDAELPPLLDVDRDQCWRVRADRTTERAAWPPV
ncbi:FtsK/SpoIIIE domain-containing protein [Agromyces sp. SYSU T00266]|uniref:FtsK/SpoIIIE domain-containing protein n=1 Tax=Agromyces zhanjiangensis TaxID=3158562 RepID=UPI0033948A82